jgi:O-antigen ligase
LKLSSYYWGFQILSITFPLVGFGPVTGVVFSNLVNSILLSYYFLLYLAFLGKQRHMGFAVPRNRFGAATTLAVLMLVWAGLSLYWCPSPVKATFYYLAYLVQVLIVYFLLKLYPIYAVIRCACRGTVYAAAITIPLLIPLTGYSGGRLGQTDDMMLVGVTALAACLGILSAIYLRLDRAISRRLAAFLVLFLFAGLLLTFSKTDIIAFALAGVVYILLAPGSIRQRTMRIAWMAMGAVIAWIPIESKVANYASSARATDTLTGRTWIWAHTIVQIMDGPTIRGFGFLAFREIGPVSPGTMDHLVHAHNEFLTLWFNFGIVGVVLVFTSYFALGLTSVRAMRRGGGAKAVLVLCALIFCLVMGVTLANMSICVLPIPWLFLFDCLTCTYLANALGPVHANTFILGRIFTDEYHG